MSKTLSLHQAKRLHDLLAIASETRKTQKEAARQIAALVGEDTNHLCHSLDAVYTGFGAHSVADVFTILCERAGLTIEEPNPVDLSPPARATDEERKEAPMS